MNSVPYKNHAHVAGFVGNDPQMRFLPGGDAVMSLRVATKHFWKDLSGEWKSATEWHTAVFYRQLAELANSYAFKKGEFIDLEGRLHTREWQDEQKRRHASREVLVERFHRVDLAALQKQDQTLGTSQDTDDSHSHDHPVSGGPDGLDAFRKLT